MRILLKLSGDSLSKPNGNGVSSSSIQNISQILKQAKEMGNEIGICIGAGNFFRGRDGQNITRATADNMGMLATVMNSIALSDGLNHENVKSQVYSNISIPKMCKTFDFKQAIEDMENGKIVILAGGSGNPYFTTDTASALKALELNVDVFLLGKNIDGVYDSDPKLNLDAKKFDFLTYDEILKKDLKVMDKTAVTLCMENNVKIHVFDMMNRPQNLIDVLSGKQIGTIVN